jgi:hypothetical protein
MENLIFLFFVAIGNHASAGKSRVPIAWSRKNNRARAGKSEVSESVEKPTVQEWEIQGFHVQPRKKS